VASGCGSGVADSVLNVWGVASFDVVIDENPFLDVVIFSCVGGIYLAG
jgi:arginine exporter protein ArgO